MKNMIVFGDNHEYPDYLKFLLQTKYSIKTLEILIQKTSINMLQEEKNKKKYNIDYERHIINLE